MLVPGGTSPWTNASHGLPGQPGQPGQSREIARVVKSVTVIGINFRIACLSALVLAAIGLALHRVVPYVPVFALLVLVASLLALLSAVEAALFARRLGSAARAVGGLLRTATYGGFVALLFSIAGTIAGLASANGGIATGGDRSVLLVISVVTLVISVASLALGFVLSRRVVSVTG